MQQILTIYVGVYMHAYISIYVAVANLYTCTVNHKILWLAN